MGQLVSSFSRRFGTSNSLVAECRVIHDNIILAKHVGVQFVHLKTNVVSVDKHFDESSSNFTLMLIILDYRKLMFQFHKMKFRHISESKCSCECPNWIDD